MPAKKTTTRTKTKTGTIETPVYEGSEDKKLYRSVADKVLGGVAGGLGNYFNVDSTVVRLIFILLFVFGGSGLLIYLILWLIIPSEKSSSQVSGENIRENADEIRDKAQSLAGEMRQMSEKENPRSMFGLLILVIGVLFLLNNFGIFRFFDLGRLWPLVLVVIGLAILFRNDKR